MPRGESSSDEGTVRPNAPFGKERKVRASDAQTPQASPFRYFNSSPEIIRLEVMYVRYPLSLRNVEDFLFERGIEICEEAGKSSAPYQPMHSGWKWRQRQ